MSDSVQPVAMPDPTPTPRRRNGGEVPPPRAWMPGGFGAPRSLQSVAKPSGKKRPVPGGGGWNW